MPRVQLIHRNTLLREFGKDVEGMKELARARAAFRLRKEHRLNTYRVKGTRALCYSKAQVERIVDSITQEINVAA